jgi:2-Cys peroxiredoxin 5
MNSRVFTLVATLFAACSVASGFSATGNAFLTTTSLASSVAGDSSTMTVVKVGDAIPSVVMKELVTGADGPVDVNLAELCAGKKVAMFGLPGAFTPGCSKSHLPSFMEAQDELKSKVRYWQAPLQS